MKWSATAAEAARQLVVAQYNYAGPRQLTQFECLLQFALEASPGYRVLRACFLGGKKREKGVKTMLRKNTAFG